MAALIGMGSLKSLCKDQYRHLLRCCVGCRVQRSYVGPASPFKYLTVIPDKTAGINILEMNRPPVNSLNLEFLTELNIALEKMENDKDIRGVIITSNIPGIFCAGLDLHEFKMKLERLREFWKSFQDFWIHLYGSRLAAVAAISGHALAGGAVIGACCDYRIMVSGKATIGMTETLLGLVPPFWVFDTFYNTIGFRKSESVMQLAKKYTAEEALTLGLIDEVASSSQLMAAAKHHMNEYLLIPDVSRQLVKTQMRKNTLLKLQTRREEDIQAFIDIITKDHFQKLLLSYLESLKNKT